MISFIQYSQKDRAGEQLVVPGDRDGVGCGVTYRAAQGWSL